MPELLKIILEDSRTALMLLTRIPLPSSNNATPTDIGRSAWFYPIVGLLVGSLSALVFYLADYAGVPTSLAVLIMMVSTLLLTGAFHEDGLADMADGIGGGRTREQKLEIMRDSRVGTYGVIALVFGFALRFTSYVSIKDTIAIMYAVLLAASISRTGLVLMMFFMSPARDDGMGASAGKIPLLSLLIAITITAGIAYILPYGFEACFAAVIGLVLTAWAAKKYLGGYTGDVLGAGQQLSEICILVSLSASMPHLGP